MMNRQAGKNLNWVCSLILLISFTPHLFANLCDFASNTILDNNIELELLGGELAVCEGTSLDLENIPIREVNGIVLESLNYYLDQACQNQITTSFNNVFTENISIWAKGTYQGCEFVLEIPIVILTAPVLLFNQDNIVLCQGESLSLADIDIVNTSGFGSDVTFHTEDEPSIENLIDRSSIVPEVGFTNIYAYSDYEDCSTILAITIQVEPAPELVITTQPLVCSGLPLFLDQLNISDINNIGAQQHKFYWNEPFVPANEITQNELNPTADQIIFAVALFGDCVSVLEVEITVAQAFYAGVDDSFNYCSDEGVIELNDLLADNVDPGVWTTLTANPNFDPVTNTFDTDGADVNTYQFMYSIASEGTCNGDDAMYEIVLTEAPFAGDNTYFAHCASDATLVNLFAEIADDRAETGFFQQVDGGVINLTSPTNQDLFGYQPGEYTYEYIVNGTSPCDADTSLLLLEIIPDPDIFDVEYRCSEDLTEYSIIYLTDAWQVITDSNLGITSQITVGGAVNGMDEFATVGIDINHTIELTLTTVDGCMIIRYVEPPECDCPYVAEPINEGDVDICLPEAVRPLIVEVEDWQGVNWYDAFEDGDLLLANSNEYFSPERDIGIYYYWAEAFSLANPDCISEERTLVTLTIDETPQADPIVIFGCSDGNLVDYDLSTGNASVGPDLFVSYYAGLVDATSGENILDLEYQSAETNGEILSARVENMAGCFTIVQATLNPNPYPDVDYEIFQITCGTDEGRINIINNDPSQDLEVFLNGASNNANITGLSAGTNSIEIENQYGCRIDTSITIQTAFEYVVLETGCNDNGTPGDDTDDFLFIDFHVNPPGGGAQFDLYRYDDSDGFNYLNEDTWDFIGTYNYGELNELEFPLHEFGYTWVFIDLDDPTCSDRKIFAPYTTCSDLCGINNATIHFDLSDCDNAGTPFDHTDDVVTFGIEASGSNLGDFWYLQNDPTFMAPYDEIVTYGPMSLGTVDTLFLVDEEVDTCFYPLTTYELRNCSDGCSIMTPPVAYNLIDCDSLDTPYDNEDDLYTLQLWIQNEHIGRVEFFIEYGDEVRGPYLYNQTVVIDSVPAENMFIDLLFRDATDPDCTAQAPQLIATPCSACFNAVDVQDSIFLNCNFDPEIADIDILEPGEFTWYFPDSEDIFSLEEQPEFDTQGSYILEVEHDTGCTSRDTLEVVFNYEDPLAEAGQDQVITCANEMATMIGGSTQFADVSFNWYDESNNLVSTDQIFLTEKEGVYTLITVNENTLCESQPDMVTITIDKEEPQVSDIMADPSTEINCQFDAIQLIPQNTSPDYEYTWTYDGEEINIEELEATNHGIYTLEVTDTTNGCTQQLDIEITRSDDFPIVEYTDPVNITCSNATSEIVVDASNIENFMTVTWYDSDEVAYPNEDGNTLTVEEGGSYFIEVYNPQNDCKTYEEIIVVEDVEIPFFELGQDTFVPCQVEEIEIIPQFSDEFDNLFYEWGNLDNHVSNAQMSSLLSSEQGEYYLQVTDLDNDCMAFDTIAIVDNPNIIDGIGLDVSQVSCFGEDNGGIEISDFGGSGTGFNVSINGDNSNVDFVYDDLSPGTYYFSVTNDQDCEFLDTVVIDTPTEISWTLFPEDQQEVYNLGDTIQISAETNIPEDNILDVNWSFGGSQIGDSLSTNVILYESGVYEFELLDIFGCEIRDQLSLIVSDELTDFYIPNIISCQVDDEDSVFMVYGEKQVQRVISMHLFDRWGNLVFESNNFNPGEIDKGWDCFDTQQGGGSTHIGAMTQGVYVFRIEVLLLNNETRIFTGNFTVIK